jgi:hypothetical protein
MADSDKNIRITTNKNKATLKPNIVFTGASAGTSVLTLEVRDDNTVAFTGIDGDVFSLDYNLSTGTIWSVNDKSGTPFLRASAGGTIGIAELGSSVLLGVGQSLPQYKFDVKGWAGFASSGDGSYTVLIENGASAGNNALSIRAANALRFYNTGNTLYTAFVGSQSGVNTTYILPPTSPSSIGASFLTSTQSGTLAWIAAPSGSSSGTVNSGTQNYAAYYATSTTAVSQNANLQFTGTGLSVGGNLNSTSTTSGSIYVWGGLGITGNAFIGGTAYIPSTTPSNISNLLISNSTVSTSTTSGALVITGGVGIGGSLFTSTGSSSSVSGVVFANGNVSASTYNKVTITAPTNSATLALVEGSSLSTAGANSLTLTTGGTTNVTFPTGTKTLVATDVTSLPSLTTASALNSLGTITSGTWSATAITSFYGGTGYVTYSIGDLLVGFGGTLAKLPVSSTSGQVLTSNGTGSVPSWQSVPPAAASSVAVAPTTVGAQFYIPVVNSASSAAIGLSTVSTLVINPNTNLVSLSGLAVTAGTNASTTQAAALTVTGGLGITGNAFIGGTTVITSNQSSSSAVSGALTITGGVGIGLSASIGGRLQMFNGSLYTAFLGAQSGVNTTYTLPPTSPSSIGASFLTSTQSGVMAWISAPTGGSATPGGVLDGSVQYKSGSSFGGTRSLFYDSVFQSLKVSGYPGSDLVSSTTAAFSVEQSYGTFSGSVNGTMIAVNSNSGFTGSLLDLRVNNASRFLVSNAGALTIGNAFTLPTTDGGTNQVLQTNGSGTVSWATVSSTGAGSGTVAIPGAQYQVAAYYWSATGASVSGSTTFTNNTATATARITHTTPSTSTSTGALVVDGSVGVGGSLYVGGQINQTYQPTSGAAIDHAVFIQSAPVQTPIGSLIQIGPAAKWDGTTAGYFTGSFAGTFIGINAASGNTADFLNFQQNGQPVFKVGAGGTTFQIGQPLDYVATDVLASFKSTVNSYAQFIIQNKSSGANASADFVLNNDQSNDTTFFGNLGMNSSGFSGAGALAAPNAVYLTSTSAPLVLATTTQHPIRILTNGSTTDLMYIHESGTAISVFTNLDLRTQNDLRFFNSGNTFYTGIQAANNTANYTLSLPTAPVGAGSSLIIVGSDSNMYFVAPGSGIAFSSAISNAPIIRAKRPLNLLFTSGFTPLAAGSDTAIIRVPESATDGTTVLTYNLRRFQVRVETPSAGSSRLQLERSSTDTGAFALAATGSSHIGGFGVTISGAGIYLTSVTSFAGSLVTSGNLLRLNWTLLNATHANFSVNLILEEV